MTLNEVAVEAGVTKGFLSLVERGKSQVSVPTLLRICEALDTPLGALFEYPSETVVTDGTPMEMGGAKIAEYLLTPNSDQGFQVMRTVLQPGGGSGGAYRTPADSIFVVALRGEILLTVDGDERRLTAGSSTTFPAQALHEWTNPSDSVAEVMWVVSPPIPRSELSGRRFE